MFCDASGLGDSRVALESLSGVVSRDGAILSARAYGGSARHFSSRLDGVAFELVDTTSMSTEAAHVLIVADALELCYTKPGVGTFLLVAGNDALAPLAVKLRELGRRVVAVTPKGAGRSLASASDTSAVLGEGAGVEIEASSRTDNRPPARRERTRREPNRRERPTREATRREPTKRDSTRQQSAEQRRSGQKGVDTEAPRDSQPPRSSRDRAPAVKEERTRRPQPREESESRPKRAPSSEEPASPPSLKEAMKIVRETVDHLARRFGDAIWPSTLSDVLKDRHKLSEKDLGFTTFDEFLSEAEKHDALVLQRNPRSGKVTIYSLEEDDS